MTRACSSCGVEAVVMVTQRIAIGRRVVEWTLCVPCRRRERELGDERGDAADRQAEKAGV
jgi:hypothetical protein